MKIRVFRNQSEETKGRISKSILRTYSLKLVAEITNEELQLLNKYNSLAFPFMVNVDRLIADVESHDTEGPIRLTLNDLQNGVEWKSTFLPVYFYDIPRFVQDMAKNILGSAIAREVWGGEEVLEIEI